MTSGLALSSWIRPSTEHQFTSPILYSATLDRLLSAVYHRGSKSSRLCIWRRNDFQIDADSIALDARHLEPSEVIIRVFELFHDPQPQFLLVTNLGKMTRFNVGTNVSFGESSNGSMSNTDRVRFVKIHRTNSRSKSIRISMVWNDGKMRIYQFFRDKKSISDPLTVSIPEKITFCDPTTIDESDDEKDSVDEDEDDDDDDDLNEDDDDLKLNEVAAPSASRIIDYDLCSDSKSKMSVFALSEHGVIHCFTEKGHRFRFDLSDKLKISGLSDWHKVAANNAMFGVHHSSLLSYVRIHCLEAAQFAVIGPSRSQIGTLSLWTMDTVNASITLRDCTPLIAQNATSRLLWIAPIRSVMDSQSVTVYVVTSKKAISIRLPLFGQSLLHRIRASMQSNGTKKAISFSSFMSAAKGFLERGEWRAMEEHFKRIGNVPESDLLLVLSLMLSHLEYQRDDISFMAAFDAILSTKFNDIFMKRSIEILPQSQIQCLIDYLCRSLDRKERSIGVETLINWLSITLDAHSGTLAFCGRSAAMRRCIGDIGKCLKQYDENMQSLIEAEAQIHSILHTMKEEDESRTRGGKRARRGTAKMESGGLPYTDDEDEDANAKNADLYKDYVVEYIKL